MGYLFLAFSDGTTTCTVADGLGGATNYRLAYETWHPKIADLVESELGGSVYERVTERLTLNVYGASEAAAYANLQTLIQLLQQAGRWARGENVGVVLLQFSPAGASVSSRTSPLQAKIWRADFEIGSAIYDPDARVLRNVHASITRDGEWMHTTEVKGYSVQTPATGNVAFTANLKTISPVRVKARIDQITAGDIYEPVYLWYTPSDNRLVVFSAELLSNGSDWLSQADAANYAQNGSVIRCTPTSVAETTSGSVGTSASILSTARRFALYAAVRNNSASVSWLLRGQLDCRDANGGVGGSPAAYTRQNLIDTSSTNPRIICLGTAAIAAPHYSLRLKATPSSIAGTPTLDIDWVLVQAIDDVRSGCLMLNRLNQDSTPATGTYEIEFDPRELSAISPSMNMTDSVPTSAPYSFTGGLACVSDGSSFSTCLAALSRLYPARWRPVDNAAAQTFSFTLTRRKCYVVPE